MKEAFSEVVLEARGRSMSSELTTRFENQLLYAPIQQFGDVEFGFRRARDFVDPTELLELFA